MRRRPSESSDRRRVSFASSEEVHEFDSGGANSGSVLIPPPVWFSSFFVPEDDEKESTSAVSSEASTVASGSTGTPAPALPRRRSSDSKFVPLAVQAFEALQDERDQIKEGKKSDVQEEWSELSTEARKKLQNSKKKGKKSMQETRSMSMSRLSPLPDHASSSTSSTTRKRKVKKKKKKAKKKRKDVEGENVGVRKKSKKRRKKAEDPYVNVLAFLRGSVKRKSSLRLQTALRKMMSKVAKKFKVREEMKDGHVDITEVKKEKAPRRRKKKKLYRVNKIRGQPVGLRSLMKQWKWAFIFS